MNLSEYLNRGEFHVSFFVELEFFDAVERYWSGIGEITHEGEAWLGVGGLGNISPINSTSGMEANGLEVGLHGLPLSASAGFQARKAKDYKGRNARFIIGFMNRDFNEVVHQIIRYSYIDEINYSVSAESGISASVKLEPDTKAYARANNYKYTDATQKTFHPNDRGLEYVNYINSGVDVKWGTAGAFFK